MKISRNNCHTQFCPVVGCVPCVTILCHLSNQCHLNQCTNRCTSAPSATSVPVYLRYPAPVYLSVPST
jgi:hypothetical protein